MSSAYGTIARPGQQKILPPYPIKLKDGTDGTILHITSNYPAPTPPEDLVSHLSIIFNEEIERGQTYPFEEVFSLQQFKEYFLSYDGFVAVRGNHSTWKDLLDKRDWEETILGLYYIKPNYPGRSSHICNGGFMVPPSSRNLGVATRLANSFIKHAPQLGYVGSIFNLVYQTNVNSLRIWDNLGFERVGRIPKAGKLRDTEGYVDAIVFWYDFTK